MHDNYNRKTVLRTLKDTVSRADRCDLVGARRFLYMCKRNGEIITLNIAYFIIKAS